MRKVFRVTLLSCFVMVCLPVLVCSAKQVPKGKVIRLKVADHLPAKHTYTTHGIVEWMKRVTKETNGAVKFDFFPAGQAGDVKDYLTMLQTGVVDIAVSAPPYFSGQMPLGNVVGLPGWDSDAVQLTAAYYPLITDKNSVFFKIDHERNQIIPLVTSTLGPYQLVTKKPVKALKDVYGLRLRSAGGSMDWVISAMKGTPIAMPSVESYESLSRGILEGAFYPLDAVTQQKLNEVTKYFTINLKINTFIHEWSIGKRAWDKLPKDIQDTFMRIGKETSFYYSEVMKRDHFTAIKHLESIGMIATTLSSEEIEKFNEATKTVAQKWAKSLEDQGLPAQQALQQFENALERVKSK